jgi:hypothetical protein
MHVNRQKIGKKTNKITEHVGIKENTAKACTLAEWGFEELEASK